MRAIIVYGSFVGNTETMAGYVATGLREAGLDVRVVDVIRLSPDDILGYDLLLLASPTYEPRMIQDDMLPFMERLGATDISGKLAAAFGPGDSAWPDFCTAVEMLEARLRESGARLVRPGLMLDGIVEEQRLSAEAWGREVALAALALLPKLAS